jgi:hypothetical protein
MSGVDLYIRKDVDIMYAGSVAQSDYRLDQGLTAFRTMTITNPAAGTYFIAYGFHGPNVNGSAFNLQVTGTLSSNACTYTILGGTTLNAPATGYTGSFSLSTDVSCAYSPAADVTWIQVLAQAITGPGLINFAVSSNTGVARTGHISVGGQIFTIFQAGVTANNGLPDNALIISQFAAGGGQWTSTLFLTNVSNVSESYTLRFYDDNGGACEMPFTSGSSSLVTGALLPGETRRLETTTSGSLKVCWGTLVPGSVISKRITGFAVFKQSAAGSSSEAVVGLTGPRDFKQVLVYDNTGGLVTSMALVNTDPVLTSYITAQIYDETGAYLGQDTVQLPPLGHIAVELFKRFPITAGRRGTIRFNGTPQAITGLGLRFSSNLNFTSFPLLTTPDIQ